MHYPSRVRGAVVGQQDCIRSHLFLNLLEGGEAVSCWLVVVLPPLLPQHRFGHVEEGD